MNRRTLPDTHYPHYDWCVVNGERAYRSPITGMWWTRQSDHMSLLFEPTPARCAMWADLMLQPFES